MPVVNRILCVERWKKISLRAMVKKKTSLIQLSNEFSSRSFDLKEIGRFLPALPREHSTFHSILFARANKLILFLTETRYGTRRLALSLRTMPDALMCGWFSRRASRVSIKICDGKYRNNESARQQIDVSKSMRAPAIFALFPHILFSPLFFSQLTCIVQTVFKPRALVKMNFYGVFLVCKRSNRDKAKFQPLVDRFCKFSSSHSRIIIGATKRGLSIKCPIRAY